MRTTVNLDDEIYQLASSVADARDITLGEAIGELIRSAQSAKPVSRVSRSPNGFPLLPRRGGPAVTTDLVKRLEAREGD